MNNIILTDVQNILTNNKNIGIFLSGGFDSSVLIYLLFVYRQQLHTNNNIEIFTVPRYDDSVIHSDRIVNYIEHIFNVPGLVTHHVGYPFLHHNIQVLSGILDVVDRPELDIILWASTKNPDCLPDGPNRHASPHIKVCTPFLKYTKDQIVKIAIDLNLIDIMKLSHTCTESRLLRCGNCWQDKERAWAFLQNNFIDPGTM